MEIIIHGTGTMGRLIKETAENNENIRIAGFTDELATETGDVIIDFSHYSRLNSLLDYSKEKRIPLVIATTGYSNEILKKIKEAAREIPVLLSSNMSLGVSLLNDILERIVPVLYGNYDIEVIEKHHNKKVDSPSGTAKNLIETIKKSCSETMREQYGREGNRKREKNEIGIHSLRGGTIIGEHSVLFCGEDEVIEIKHTAMSKKIFAVGALKAAEFLIGKEAGIYTMKNIFENQEER
ncbi:4-hydroxy-tetrahydrodipicolinate reductase [Fusobacterium varium]|uniref:4-hydroxy-tetrahydrodipicolinate reductase n=1 Tax=Fusobacterium varium TaxID=856 RepID=UPI0035615451